MSDFDWTIDYSQRYQQAILGMLRGLLEEAAEEGIPGDHAFYISFATPHPGVELSAALRKNYPEQMTIVLQNQFWGLSTDDDAFTVTLRFGGSPENLRVPWESLTGFADPSAEFGIQLQPAEAIADRGKGDEDRSPFGGGNKDAGESGDTGSEVSSKQASSEKGEQAVGSDGDDGDDGDEVESQDADAAVLDFADFKKRS